MRNKHCSPCIVHKGRHLAPKSDDSIISCYKEYHKIFYIKTFTVDFVSVMKTEPIDCDPKHLQQVQWSGSLDHYRTSILQIEKEKKEVIYS